MDDKILAELNEFYGADNLPSIEELFPDKRIDPNVALGSTAAFNQEKQAAEESLSAKLLNIHNKNIDSADAETLSGQLLAKSAQVASMASTYVDLSGKEPSDFDKLIEEYPQEESIIRTYQKEGRPLQTVRKVIDTNSRQKFLAEYKKYAGQYGLNPNPYAPEHYYDYYSLFKNEGGIFPDESGNLPSKYKLPGHPTLIVNGIDTRTGQPATLEGLIQKKNNLEEQINKAEETIDQLTKIESEINKFSGMIADNKFIGDRQSFNKYNAYIENYNNLSSGTEIKNYVDNFNELKNVENEIESRRRKEQIVSPKYPETDWGAYSKLGMAMPMGGKPSLKAIKEYDVRDNTWYKIGDSFKNKKTLELSDAWNELMANPYKLLPYMGGVKEAVDLLGVAEIADRYFSGDKITTDEYKTLTNFAEYSKKEPGLGYLIGNVLSEQPAFWGEIASTYGLFSGGKRIAMKSGVKALSKLIGKEMSEEAVKKASLRIPLKIIGTLVGGAVQMPIGGITRITVGTIRNTMPEMQVDNDAAGEIVNIIEGGDDIGKALLNSIKDNYVEYTSEQTGGSLIEIGNIAKKLFSGKNGNRLAKLGFLRAFSKLNPGKNASDIAKFVERIGWHGTLGEIWEERVGEFGRALLGLEKYKFPSKKQMLAELISFSIPSMTFKALEYLGGTGNKETTPKNEPNVPPAGVPPAGVPPAGVPPAGVPPAEAPIYKFGDKNITRKQAIAILQGAENLSDIDGLSIENDPELEAVVAEAYNVSPESKNIPQKPVEPTPVPTVEQAGESLETPSEEPMSISDFTDKYIDEHSDEVSNLSEQELSNNIIEDYNKYLEDFEASSKQLEKEPAAPKQPVEGQVSSEERRGKELDRFPATFVPIRRNNPEGVNEVLMGGDAELAEGRIERKIENGIKEGKSVEEILSSFVNVKYAFLSSEVETIKSFIEDRIAGKTNQTFGEFRQDTHKEINAKYDAELQLGLKVPEVTTQPEVKASIPKESKSLVEEARKYKSAEEFVKAQGKPLFRAEDSNLATDKLSLQQMMDMKPESSSGGGISFATNKGKAMEYGKADEFILSPNAKIATGYDLISDLAGGKVPHETWEKTFRENGARSKEAIDYLKSKGFDGYEWGSDEIVMFGKDKIKTKSQLIDIWEKAHEKRVLTHKKTQEVQNAEGIGAQAEKAGGEVGITPQVETPPQPELKAGQKRLHIRNAKKNRVEAEQISLLNQPLQPPAKKLNKPEPQKLPVEKQEKVVAPEVKAESEPVILDKIKKFGKVWNVVKMPDGSYQLWHKSNTKGLPTEKINFSVEEWEKHANRSRASAQRMSGKVIIPRSALKNMPALQVVLGTCVAHKEPSGLIASDYDQIEGYLVGLQPILNTHSSHTNYDTKIAEFNEYSPYGQVKDFDELCDLAIREMEAYKNGQNLLTGDQIRPEFEKPVDLTDINDFEEELENVYSIAEFDELTRAVNDAHGGIDKLRSLPNYGEWQALFKKRLGEIVAQEQDKEKSVKQAFESTIAKINALKTVDEAMELRANTLAPYAEKYKDAGYNESGIDELFNQKVEQLMKEDSKYENIAKESAEYSEELLREKRDMEIAETFVGDIEFDIATIEAIEQQESKGEGTGEVNQPKVQTGEPISAEKPRETNIQGSEYDKTLNRGELVFVNAHPDNKLFNDRKSALIWGKKNIKDKKYVITPFSIAPGQTKYIVQIESKISPESLIRGDIILYNSDNDIETIDNEYAVKDDIYTIFKSRPNDRYLNLSSMNTTFYVNIKNGANKDEISNDIIDVRKEYDKKNASKTAKNLSSSGYLETMFETENEGKELLSVSDVEGEIKTLVKQKDQLNAQIEKYTAEINSLSQRGMFGATKADQAEMFGDKRPELKKRQSELIKRREKIDNRINELKQKLENLVEVEKGKTSGDIFEKPAETAPEAAPELKPEVAQPTEKRTLTHKKTQPLKEPWQMTKDEFIGMAETRNGEPVTLQQSSDLDLYRTTRTNKELKEIDELIRQENIPMSYKDNEWKFNPIYTPKNEHRAFIRYALSEGKPVPPEVLADYPDLKGEEPTRPAEKTQRPKFLRKAIQTETPDDKSLIALHNLNQNSIEFADKLGGLPAPSIAITKAGMPFDKYGDITLIARKEMIDPDLIAVFNADIYSGKSPEIKYDIKRGVANKFLIRLANARKKHEDTTGTGRLEEDIERKRKEGLEYSAKNDLAMKGMFLEEIGKNPEPIYKPKRLYNDWSKDPEVIKWYKSVDWVRINGESKDSEYNIKTYDEYKKVATDAIKRMYGDHEDKQLVDILIKKATESYSTYHNTVDDVWNIINKKKEIDKNKTENKYDSMLKEIGEDKFTEWINNISNSMFVYPHLVKGGKKLPVNLRNMVDLTVAGGLKSKEKNLVFGLGQARSLGAKRFNSTKAMHNAEERIVPKTESDKIYENNNKRFFGIADAIKNKYKYYVGNEFSFDRLDDLSKAIGTYLKNSPKTISGMRAALYKNNYIDVPDGYVEELMELADAIRESPTEYFEAKPERAIAFSEFAGAVIPKGTSENVRNILKKHGIKIVEYDPKIDGDRANKIKNFDYDKTRFAKRNKTKTAPKRKLVRLTPADRISYNEWKANIDADRSDINAMLNTIEERANIPINIDDSINAYMMVREANDIYTNLFGEKEVIVLDKPIGIDGVHFGGRIFISSDCVEPVKVVFTHELMHEIKESKPELYAELMEVYREELDADVEDIRNAYTNIGIDMSDLSDDEIMEEALNTFVGRHLGDNGFWDKLNNKNPSLARRFLEFLKNLIRKVRNYFSGRSTNTLDSFVQDQEKVIRVAENIIGEYGEGKNNKPVEQTQTLSLSDKYDKEPLYGLKQLAKKFDKFEDFERAYTIDIQHGIYWHVTSNPDFTISGEISPRDMSTMAAGGGYGNKGALMVTSDLPYWDWHYNYKLDDEGFATDERLTKRGYAAQIDLSDIDPKYIKQTARGFGNEIFLSPEIAKKAKVVKVIPIDEALKQDEKYGEIKPQSSEELRKLWVGVHGEQKKTAFSLKDQTQTPEFKKWFKNSKTVDKNGKPLVLYSGHPNPEMWGTKYNARMSMAGGFYATDSPEIAWNYAVGKPSYNNFTNGGQYRLRDKSGNFTKRLYQYELSDEQKRKIDELLKEKDEFGESVWGINEMQSWVENNYKYDKLANRIKWSGGIYNLQNIFDFNEVIGYNITHEPPINEENKYSYETQRKNETELIMDKLGIKWNSYYWQQPGIFPVYLSIQNPIDTSKPFPADLLEALKNKAKHEKIHEANKFLYAWTKHYPLRNWIDDIEAGRVYWSTQIPENALPIIENFGYDGIKEKGLKAVSGLNEEERNTNWIAFRPTQIKSATGNVGTFDATNPDIRFMKAPIADTYYLQSMRSVENKFPDKMVGKSVINWLRNNQVKPEEIEWLGIEDFVKDKLQVTKSELLDFIRANNIQIEEIRKGVNSKLYDERFRLEMEITDIIQNDEIVNRIKKEYGTIVNKYINGDTSLQDKMDEFEAKLQKRYDEILGDRREKLEQIRSEIKRKIGTKYNEYTIPGGENYRELLLKFPVKKVSFDEFKKKCYMPDYSEEDYDDYIYDDNNLLHRSHYLSDETVKNLYQDYLDEKVFANEEATFRSKHWDEPNVLAHIRFNERTDADGNKVLFLEEIQSDWAQSLKEGKTNINMPFKSEKSWSLLAFKRMIRWAAENGFDKIAWTTGEQQAERYDLSKQVESVIVDRIDNDYMVSVKDLGGSKKDMGSFKKEALPNVLGKELAQKIINEVDNGGHKIYSGLDLKIGGEGMKVFYDEKLKGFIDKYVKHWGSKVEYIKIGGGNAMETREDVYLQDLSPVPSVEVTPAMRESVLRLGQPMFMKSATSRLEKKTKELEEKIKPFGKGGNVKETHYESNLIKEKIKAIEQGHRLGQLDTKEYIKDIQKQIRSYAQEHLPKDSITRGQVTQLLTKIENAKDIDTIKEAFDKIDKIFNSVSDKIMRAKIKKLVARYKPKKKNGIVRSKLVPEEQAALDEISEIINSDRKDMIDKIEAERAEIISNMRAYRPDTSDEELNDSIDLTDIKKRLRNVDLYSELKDKTGDELKEIYEEIKSIVEDGKTRRAVLKEIWKKKVADHVSMALGDILPEGGAVLSKFEAQSKRRLYKRRKFLKCMSFEYVLDAITLNKSAKTLRGKMTDTLNKMVHRSRNKETAGTHRLFDVFNAKLREIYGRGGILLEHTLNKNSREKDTGIIVERLDPATNEINKVELRLSQNQAYKIWQWYKDPSLKSTFDEMGFTPEVMQKIEEYMTPEVKKWAEWQIYEFYPEYYKEINEQFRKHFHMDMPFNPFYSPLYRSYVIGENIDDPMLGVKNVVATVLNSHLKNRVRNKIPVDTTMDGDNVLARHVLEMEHFKAWDDTIKLLRAIFNNKDVYAAIEQYHGHKANKVVDRFINDLATGGINKSSTLRILDWIRSHYVRAVLASPVIMLKQMTAIPAFALDTPVVYLGKGITSFLFNPVKAIKTLSESEYLRARYGIGWERDVIAAMQRTTTKKMAGRTKISELLMIFPKYGDKFSVLIGGWSVYQYHYDKAIKNHLSPEKAKEIAMEEFELSVARTQQAGNVEDLGEIQRMGSFARFMTMFITAQNAYFRQEYTAARNIFRGRAGYFDNLRRFIIAHFILPMIFQFVASGFRWEKEKQLRAMVVGSLNGILIAGDIIEALGEMLFEGTKFTNNVGELPPLSPWTDIGLALGEINKMASEGELTTDDWNNTLKAIVQNDNLRKEFLSGTSKIVGVPYDIMRRYYESYEDISSGKTKYPFRRAIGFSRYMMGESNLSRKKQNKLLLEPAGSFNEQEKVRTGNKKLRKPQKAHLEPPTKFNELGEVGTKNE